MLEKLVMFLQEELDIPAEQVHLALRNTQAIPSQLPMQLWNYGLINLGQLEKIFDWLEVA
ncbi:DUF2949 domain-containing protein [Crocosphaera sp. XPORK-15E]|uniref:DUF2949 domain-containing protein n=1 Tax=Crocosphaera sp. XPORK-15E TaxID=3110247 RepID=UPI002B200478|nr:DUF2949 domain-containing protein [Crocosphaera sp. XPORK-15E]MEA5533861.1 DUF2949 domain-containing protein [Crocosphaera sp. XPORK-15E]